MADDKKIIFSMVGVSKMFPPHKQVLKDIYLSFFYGAKIGIIGLNGSGKSTLLKIIAGVEKSYQGEVVFSPGYSVGYLEQEPKLDPEKTVKEVVQEGVQPILDLLAEYEKVNESFGDPDVLENQDKMEALIARQAELQDHIDASDAWNIDNKLERAMDALRCPPEDQLVKFLSGGERRRVALCRLLLQQPDILLLDEPTNHLDLLSLLWLQRYLKNYPGAILMISHDRDFMDELVESVYDIDNEELVEYRGNYSDFLQQKDVRFEQLQAAYRNQQKEIAHIQEFIDRFRSINSKAGQVQSRIKQLEKMKIIQKPVARRKVFKFNFPQPPRSTQKVIELEKVCQSYGDRRVYENLDLLVERGERTVLVGPNGAGKSTLLKILAGIIPIDSGQRTPGTTTRIGYFSQARTENLNPENTVLEEIMKCSAEIREEEARSILGSFLFRRLDVEKRVSVLSGGEKSRLSLVKFLVDPPNLLLMDEPTTHLDLLSVEALVQALKHYEGTLVFISHDVHFIRSLAQKTLHVNRGTITAYAGGYDYYLEKSGILDDEKGGITAE